MGDQEELSGEFGKNAYFSDLFAKCIELEFSGGVLVWSEQAENEGRVFFIRGRPFHCSGEIFAGNQIGVILEKLGMVTQDDVDLALRVQELQEGKDKELLGELLSREARVPEAAIEAALQIQTKKRLIECFGISRGMWRGLWSKREDIVKKGAVIEPWDVLLPGLTNHASDTELRDFSDDVLGTAVKLTCPIEALESYGVGEEHLPILELLEKPRRPDHIEKVHGRKETRTLLKTLNLAGLLEKSSAKKGVPIAKPRVKPRNTSEPEIAPREETPVPKPTPRVQSTISKYDDATLKVIADIDSLFEKLESLNYFEVLEATPQSNGRELRAKYTEMVRKFHPDTLGSKKLSPETMSKAADISSRLNEAFQTLTSDEARAEYLKIFNDARIGGKINQKALLEEAEKKFKMATVLLKKKDFKQAREYLNYACKTIPEDGRFKAHLAWSLWIDPSLMNDAVIDRVIELLSESVELSPDDPDAHFYFGSVLKMNGDIQRAIKHFKKCVELKSNYTEAIRELRLLRSRSRPK